MLRLICVTLILVLGAPFSQAQDTSRDQELITTIDQETLQFIAQSLGHTNIDRLTDATGVSAKSGDLQYILRGEVCADESTCLGVGIYIIFNDALSLEDINELNSQYSVIKVVRFGESTVFMRYLILDGGQTIANIKASLRNLVEVASVWQSSAEADASIEFGDDTGQYAHDGTCDDARFHVDGDEWDFQRNHVLRDASDCRSAYQEGAIKLVLDFGDNSGGYADDNTCDDVRFTGPGRSILETNSHIKKDAADCISAYRAGTISRQ